MGIFRANLLKDKVAIVTGGATGIGAEIAFQMLSLGAKVVIASRKEERCQTAAQHLSEMTGSEAIGLGCNIREQQACVDLVKQTKEHFGGIDILVNNGGGQFMSPAENINARGWNAVIETNLTGTWNLTQAVAKNEMLKKGGKIMNITMLTQRGWPGMAHSVSARSGVEALTKTLAVEWAKNNIRINCIQPGIVASSGVKNYPAGKAMFTQIQKEIPLKRLGSCEEVGQMACFLASEAGDYITGQILCVDGGRSLWGRTWPVPDPKELPEIHVPSWPWEK